MYELELNEYKLELQKVKDDLRETKEKYLRLKKSNQNQPLERTKSITIQIEETASKTKYTGGGFKLAPLPPLAPQSQIPVSNFECACE